MTGNSLWSQGIRTPKENITSGDAHVQSGPGEEPRTPSPLVTFTTIRPVTITILFDRKQRLDTQSIEDGPRYLGTPHE